MYDGLECKKLKNKCMMDCKYFPMLYKDYSRYHQVTEYTK
jgi:hypothetical protein